MPADFDVPAALLEQWDGNRRLTLRVARAFPADRLCAFAPVAPRGGRLGPGPPVRPAPR